MRRPRTRFRRWTTTLAFSLTLAACADIFGVDEYQPGQPEEIGGTFGGGASGAGVGGGAGMSSGGTGDVGGDGGNGDGAVGGSVAGSGGVGGGAGMTSGGGAGVAGEAGMTSGGGAGVAGGGGTAGESPCGPLDAEWDFENGGPDGFYTYGYPAELEDNTFIAVDEMEGSLRVTAGFDASLDNGRDQAIFAADAFLGDPRDLRGKVVFACVRFVEKLDGALGFPRANAYVESGQSEITGSGPQVPLDDVETWETIRVDVDTANVSEGDMPYAPDQIIRIGVRIATGSSGSYGPVIVAIGAVWIEDA